MSIEFLTQYIRYCKKKGVEGTIEGLKRFHRKCR
ncbi:hypothetical protein K144312032_12430 [Clostridium tetani]|nr:hypothetical protein K144312032_12430 [Clostridium tetani]